MNNNAQINIKQWRLAMKHNRKIEETFEESFKDNSWDYNQRILREQRRSDAQRRLNELINPSQK